MNDENDVQQDLTNEIEGLIDAALQKDYVQAEKHFSAAIGDKVLDALDAQRVNVADTVWNNKAAYDAEESESEN